MASVSSSRERLCLECEMSVPRILKLGTLYTMFPLMQSGAGSSSRLLKLTINSIFGFQGDFLAVFKKQP